VIACDDEEDRSPGHVFTKQLRSITPVKGVFFAAVNSVSSNSNLLSNYCTDSFDVYAGENSIEFVSMGYQTSKKYDKVPAELFSDEEPYLHMPSCPERPGYHVVVYGSNFEENGDKGICLSGLETEISLFIKKDQVMSNSYRCKIRLLSFRKLSFDGRNASVVS